MRRVGDRGGKGTRREEDRRGLEGRGMNRGESRPHPRAHGEMSGVAMCTCGNVWVCGGERERGRWRMRTHYHGLFLSFASLPTLVTAISIHVKPVHITIPIHIAKLRRWKLRWWIYTRRLLVFRRRQRRIVFVLFTHGKEIRPLRAPVALSPPCGEEFTQLLRFHVSAADGGMGRALFFCRLLGRLLDR